MVWLSAVARLSTVHALGQGQTGNPWRAAGWPAGWCCCCPPCWGPGCPRTRHELSSTSPDTDTSHPGLYQRSSLDYNQTLNCRNGSSALLTQAGLDRQLARAVRDFQAFAGLNQTGLLVLTSHCFKFCCSKLLIV